MLKVSVASFNPVQGDAAVSMQRWADNKMGLVGIDGARIKVSTSTARAPPSTWSWMRVLCLIGWLPRVWLITLLCLGVKGPCLFLQIGHEGVNVWR